MRAHVVLAAGLLASLFVSSPAHARRTPSGPGRLDLQRDAWVHVGVSGGYQGDLDFGRVELAGRVPLASWLALRVSHAASMQSSSVYLIDRRLEAEQWIVEHAWAGPELVGTLWSGAWRLRVGASLEAGLPMVYRSEVELVGEDPSWIRGEWAVRGRAGMRVEGEPGFAQLEVVRAGHMETLGGVLDEPTPDPFGPPEYREPTTSALAASTFWRIDDWIATDVEASWDFDDTVLFGATVWATRGGTTMGPANWFSVGVETGSERFALGLALLRQW
jgi:hypothetical protein